jgi:hypothetical protein
MEYSVKLAQLPADVSFPERLRDRVSFDPVKGLSYRGFMTKCTYDELSALSGDPDYHRALEQLFVLTSAEMSPQSAKGKLPAALLAATIGATVLVAGAVWAIARQAPSEKPGGTESGVAVSSAVR